MVKEMNFNRSVEKMTTYIVENVKLAGIEHKEEMLGIFDNTQKLFPQWAIMTCPVMHPNINYMSENAVSVLGYSSEYANSKNNTEKYFSQVHDADKEDLFSCFNFMHNFLESIPSEQHHEYRNVLHYRYRTTGNQYIYLHDEKAVLSLNGSGNLYYALLRDITAEKKFGGVKLEIFHQQPSLIKLTEYKPSAERAALTKREGELVTLIRQGLSTKEIAWYLKISHNTVRNIKSKLFEKYSVNNTIELLNMTA